MVTGLDIISVLGFSFHTIRELYEYGKKWADAPQELRNLLIQVGHVEGIIKQMLEANIGPESALLDVLKFHPDLIKQMEELANDAQVFVDKMTTVKDDGTREVKRIKWMFKTSEVEDLTMKFRMFYGAISAIYLVDTSAAVRSIDPRMVAIERRIVLTVEKTTHVAQHQLTSAVDGALRQTIREEMGRLSEEQQQNIARLIVRTLASVAREQQEGHSQLFDELSIIRDHPQAVQGSFTSGLPPALMQTNEVASTHSLIRRSSTSSGDSDLQSIMTSATCDSLDTMSPHPRRTRSDSIHSTHQLQCTQDCPCRCHLSSSKCHFIPSTFTSGLRMHVPGSPIFLLASSELSCDDTQCVRNRESLLTMRRLFPTWFARVEGTIRHRSCPIHFKIQTPRIVKSLSFLDTISLNEFRIKLIDGDITVNDTQLNGYTILHALVGRTTFSHENQSEIYDMMHLVVDAGARYDWEYVGFTATEFMVYASKTAFRDTSIASATLESFDRNIAKPLLGEDVEETWESMREKRNWSDLHCLFANPPSSPARLKHDLAAVLSRPSAALDVNTADRFGWTPLHYAIQTCPEAVDTLLRAGANPSLVALGYAAKALSWSVVGSLVRAGANANERTRWPDGTLTAPLYDVIRPCQWYARPGDRLRTALELMRYGGHLLSWDVQDENEHTPLDCVERYVKEYPNDAEATSLYELYKSRTLPPRAHLTDTSRLEHEEGVDNFEPTSLIKAGLKGNINAIGAFIAVGAMVNERDNARRTLLHLIAMGVVSNGYTVAIELVRHGGYGVDWEALTTDGQTAEAIAGQTLERLAKNETKKQTSLKRKLRSIFPARLQRQDSAHHEINYQEAAKILELLQRRALPPKMNYLYPCMDPSYCWTCSSLRQCTAGCPGKTRTLS